MTFLMELRHRIDPLTIEPFDKKTFEDLQNHVKEIRRCFDWPGIKYHDKDSAESDRFNRWYWHNLPLLKYLHQHKDMISKASEIFGQPVKPSYVFLSMYGPEGICPLHTDRPQCQFTIDLLVHGGENWPIYIEDKPYLLEPGQAICYSGTGQKHYRKPMKEDSKATWADLAFFHFVPEVWMGELS